jgi:phage shock protein C
MSEKLYRSRVDCKIGGVCGGLGEYFSIDATIVRIIAILLVFADGVGLLGYIIAWIVVPRKPIDSSVEIVQGAAVKEEKASYTGPKKMTIPGIILIIIGILFLIKNSFWWFDMGELWPILLIIIGILMLIKHGKNSKATEKPNGEVVS